MVYEQTTRLQNEDFQFQSKKVLRLMYPKYSYQQFELFWSVEGSTKIIASSKHLLTGEHILSTYLCTNYKPVMLDVFFLSKFLQKPELNINPSKLS